jgi:hypothetical protein
VGSNSRGGGLQHSVQSFQRCATGFMVSGVVSNSKGAAKFCPKRESCIQTVLAPSLIARRPVRWCVTSHVTSYWKWSGAVLAYKMKLLVATREVAKYDWSAITLRLHMLLQPPEWKNADVIKTHSQAWHSTPTPQLKHILVVNVGCTPCCIGCCCCCCWCWCY